MMVQRRGHDAQGRIEEVVGRHAVMKCRWEFSTLEHKRIEYLCDKECSYF